MYTKWSDDTSISLTHDFSDNVNGPLSSGESVASSFGKFGESHPIAIPWHRHIIFAIIDDAHQQIEAIKHQEEQVDEENKS